MNEVANRKSRLQTARRVLLVTLLTGFLGCILSQGYFSYAYRDPAFSSPRPSEGQVYPIVITGFVSYVNEQEFKRYDFSVHKLMWPELIIFAVFIALRLF